MAPQALHDLIDGRALLHQLRRLYEVRSGVVRRGLAEAIEVVEAALLAPRPEQEICPSDWALIEDRRARVAKGWSLADPEFTHAVLRVLAAAPRPGAEQADEQASNPMTPDQLQWVLEHNLQIRAGHRVQISKAVEAWRADRLPLEQLRPLLAELRRAFDVFTIAEVNRYDGIPHLEPEELALREAIAAVLAARPGNPDE